MDKELKKLEKENKKTLAKYMGDSRKEYYADWIVEYVNSSVENSVQPIEKQQNRAFFNRKRILNDKRVFSIKENARFFHL